MSARFASSTPQDPGSRKAEPLPRAQPKPIPPVGVKISTEFVIAIGDRWARGLDPTSTGETYGYGLKLRVLPALGHLPVTQITAGVIDRTIDALEEAARGLDDQELHRPARARAR
ncbi:hypothetical protein QSJ19_14400 [Gordonia sp. ABSL11-1]|uniref:hypothetical protein n=1 Tax=Gordonia sp. ABSL11-1 TaxID=3053924 RepID=UPI0025735B7A|nr:hypothetical protein [Gordonia sp. ABSL11-1]MDL9946760.1 hypothetical protein [Gordonia sp. ABSL11-1]